MEQWIQSQKESAHHRAAIFLFPIIIFSGFIEPIMAGIGIFIFFLVTSFKLLKTMLLYLLILGGISALIPPLAPIIFIIMVFLFIMRIGYVIKNWKPFLAGIFLYGISAFFIAFIGYNVNILLSNHLLYLLIIEILVFPLVGYLLIKNLLIWLYSQGYSSSSALGIMGSAPLIVISFILPFLKLHIGGDFAAHDIVYTDGHPSSGGDHLLPAQNGMAGNNDAVRGPHLQHVQSHLRTAPDGDPTNNLSYHGPDAKVPNLQDPVFVHDYVRTVPDGIDLNNLSSSSYHSTNSNSENTYTKISHSPLFKFRESVATISSCHIKESTEKAPHNTVGQESVE